MLQVLSSHAVRRVRPGWLLGPPGPSREETLKAIEEHSQRFKGPRQGWQAKAAAWVKKVHMSRGHVEVGSLKRGFSPRFVIDPLLRPTYMVPKDLSSSDLRAYVAPYDEDNPPGVASSAGAGSAAGSAATSKQQ